MAMFIIKIFFPIGDILTTIISALISLCGLAAAIACFFIKGTAGDNTYWPDPLVPSIVPPLPIVEDHNFKKYLGIKFLWLLVVVVVLVYASARVAMNMVAWQLGNLSTQLTNSGTGSSTTANTTDDSLGLTSPCTQDIVTGTLLIQVKDPSSLFNPQYVYSGGHIYYRDQLLSNVDKKTFTIFDSSFWNDYALDKNHVYYLGEIITGADPTTFVVAANQFCEYDAHHLYYGGEMTSCTGEAVDEPVLLMQTTGSKPFSEYMYSDGKIYYSEGKINQKDGVVVPGVDNQTFTIFAGDSPAVAAYALDKNHVYYDGEIVNGADPVSFVISDQYEHDAHHIYTDGELLFSCK